MLSLIKHRNFLSWYMGISSIVSFVPLIMSVFWMGLGIPHWFFLFHLLYGSFKDNELQRWFIGAMLGYYSIVLGFLILVVSEVFSIRAHFSFNFRDLLELQVVALYVTVPLGIILLFIKMFQASSNETKTA